MLKLKFFRCKKSWFVRDCDVTPFLFFLPIYFAQDVLSLRTLFFSVFLLPFPSALGGAGKAIRAWAPFKQQDRNKYFSPSFFQRNLFPTRRRRRRIEAHPFRIGWPEIRCDAFSAEGRRQKRGKKRRLTKFAALPEEEEVRGGRGGEAHLGSFVLLSSPPPPSPQ